jgi:hypothetical protein
MTLGHSLAGCEEEARYMVKWILAAWMFLPGAGWILACVISQRWLRRASQRDRLTARGEIDFEQLPPDDTRFISLSKSRFN